MAEKTTKSIIQKSSSHWVKQLYYYAILGFSILFIAIGIFTLVRSTLVRYVFTSIDDYSYGMSQCDYTYNDKGQSPQSDSDRKICLERAEENRVKQAKNSFERDVLNGLLITAIATIVLGLHLKFVNIRD
jgi:hypothetical protein